MTMDTLTGSEHYCAYRGQQYVMRNSYMDLDFSQRVVNIRLPEDLSAADFPEAIRSGGEGENRWVVIPERLVTREWAVDVYGQWCGAEFLLEVCQGPGGPSYFGYTNDPLAGDLGVRGSQYDGWQGALPAGEVVVTRQVERGLPLG